MNIAIAKRMIKGNPKAAKLSWTSSTKPDVKSGTKCNYEAGD